ncbi:ABC transporter ATP-binding protein [Geminicoccus roseus]|uniref:ABC transporter ATP-binding protein n=1 Tax=Geminicoccus roseus TaxID=404900 RepID=UPI00040485EB
MTLASPGLPDLAAAAPLVRFEGVDKRFKNGTTALSGLDVGIGAGEFVSLLGPSGCGKSTALRLLAGLGRPSQGRIVWSGQPGLRDVGFVFQEPTLMPWATVARNVHLPLKLQDVGFAQARPRIEEALAMVGLAGFADSYPRELSGGMKMRVSIARALVTRPRILLMDEPFAALDEITRGRLNDDLLRLWLERGFTTVFVTHSVYESVFLSSRILVMAARPGRIVADLAIDAPYPRDEAFRMSGEYNQRCRAVSAALQRAMEP